MFPARKVRSAPHRRCRGLTLTELLVATALLAIATTGGLAAYARAGAARTAAGELQQLHERAQYVLATLEPELQMAGYFGGATPAPLPDPAVPEPARRCGDGIVQRLDLALQVQPAWWLACEARGGGALAGSAVLTVRRLSTRLATAPEPGRAQWSYQLTEPGRGALHWQGDAPRTAGGGTELRELILRIYYVARTADAQASVPALRVKSLTSIAGVPAFIDTEVMPGVEQLQVELLPTAAGPRFARLRLRLRSQAASTRAAAPARTLEVTRLFRLRNATP